MKANVDSGFFNVDSLPGGLIRWLETTAHVIQAKRKTNATQPAELEQMYMAAEEGCPVEALKSTSACLTPTIIYSSTKGPLLKTSWDQGCGYNTNCPIASDGPCGYAYTGCVATAMAQVMAYWKYPSTYNWSLMPASSGSAETARLMYNIGLSVSMSYSGTESSANDANIAGALKNTFKYSSAVYKSMGSADYNTIKSNLDAGEPVLLSGCSTIKSAILGIPTSYSECHEWVCDGYMQADYSTYSTLMFDMNWGWGGSCNGFYSFDSWTPSGYNFQYADDMVYNIHP